MRNKKILTLDDLVVFCEQNKFLNFNSKESGYDIYVQVPAVFEKEEESDDTILFASVKAFHTGSNRNRSNLTEKAAKECMKNMAYKPVLANFCEVDGVRDFTAHDMEFNEDGTITYLEKQVGCFTADKPYMEQDPYIDDRKYIYARVAIPRNYTDAADIIERKGGTKVSVELQVSDMSYDSQAKELILNSVEVTGLTLLGLDPISGDEIKEGMQGSRLDIQDFSFENNSIINRVNIIEEVTAAVIKQLGDIKAFAENSKEGGKPKEMEKFNELLAKYNKTVDDITFDYSNMSDDELEVAFANAFETADDSEDSSSKENEGFVEEESPVIETEASEEEVTDEAADETSKVVNESVNEFADDDPADDPADEGGSESDSTDNPTDNPADETTEDEHQSTSAIEDEDSTGTRVENSLTYSVTINGIKKDFAISLADKINAITTLVNDTYSESDNTWYYCDVFEDDGRYCVMHDFWGDRHYRQEYSVKKDVYSLKGDRVQVYAQYLTADEIAKLDKMKSDFSSIESELNSYKEKELHSQRESVLASEDYSVMADFADFNDLKEHMDEFTVDELTNKADLIYAKFMKSNYSTFSAKPEKKRGMVFMTSGSNNEEERLPYGGLFKNFKSKK